MEFEIDSELRYTLKEESCQPIVFVPDIDLHKLKEESIIDSF
jgi:hypothetical protein